MRPLQLDLSFFRSYASASIDWSGYELVVIDGPTGAGKTSLLDAIAFALYGRTPALGRPGELLSLGADHGEVRLTFAVAGVQWRVTRRLGPAAPEPLHALERLDDAGEVRDVVAGDKAVDERVERLLGMSFPAFTATVLLAQGRFDQFLRSRPADRDRILRELFGVGSLEAARLAAEASRERAEARVGLLSEERARTGAPDGRALADVARTVRGHARDVGRLRVAAPLAAAVSEAGRQLATSEAALAELEQALADLPGPAARRGMLAELEGAQQDLARAEGHARDMERELKAARASYAQDAESIGATLEQLGALGAAAARLGTVDREIPGARERVERAAADREWAAGRVDRAQRAADVAARVQMAAAEAERLGNDLARNENEVRERHTELGAAQDAETTAVERRGAATQALEAAEAALESARRGHEAAHLRSALEAGDTCPVCGGVVGLAPPAHGEHDLESIERTRRERAETARATSACADEAAVNVATATRALAAAQSAVERTRADLAHAGPVQRTDARRLDRLRTRAEAAVHALGSSEAELRVAGAAEAGLADERADLLEQLGHWSSNAAPARAIEEATERLTARSTALEGARTSVDAANRDVTAARNRSEARAREIRASLGGAVVRLEEALGIRVDRGESVTETLAAADRLAADARAGCEVHARSAAAARVTAHVATAKLAAISVNGTPEAEIAAALSTALRARATASAAWSEARRASSESVRLLTLEEDERRGAARHGQIARDLRADRFPRYLLQRYRSELAIAASSRFEELSGGRFRFACGEPDPLAIVDRTRGERTRGADTLSGGEGFVASLALALGLGDVASSAGGRLECLFLDEGFSTLDADSLETALAAVERLTGTGRLIGVITHLPGVAERLGGAIHVARDPEGRSRIVATDAP